MPLVAVRSANTRLIRLVFPAAPSVIDEVASAPLAKRSAHGGAILGLDRVDPGGRGGLNLGDRAEIAAQEIVIVDRVAQHGAAHLAGPGAAPGHGVIVRIAVPMGFQRADLWRALQARLDQRVERRGEAGP